RGARGVPDLAGGLRRRRAGRRAGRRHRADALGASRLGDVGWRVLSETGAASVLVEADDVARARRLLWARLRLAVEPGGAVAAAALVSGAYVPDADERVAVVLCGGNADPGDLTRSGVP
ncbi:MAG TPA: pyridoxal-phosphate dependent enzyme, partial [Actinomycetales bacterium]|nr:pyridoxal-phosphate dependent enzyme [Actinomycetales bacterium]